eukprot:CAMPEP_0177611654 /NCGR_PEP_ID=MMETSP0419_2-20121207/20649_1 /TAXON_ID=582737 /ORGANISM="Tetraselmis sp., Strain GSL018" /LENGTH=316 /DNA_ID=CAMNT_0019107483 /DNA_START=292 /DNA_END=1242 /DNA_ORIENTATION=-
MRRRAHVLHVEHGRVGNGRRGAMGGVAAVVRLVLLPHALAVDLDAHDGRSDGHEHPHEEPDDDEHSLRDAPPGLPRAARQSGIGVGVVALHRGGGELLDLFSIKDALVPCCARGQNVFKLTYKIVLGVLSRKLHPFHFLHRRGADISIGIGILTAVALGGCRDVGLISRHRQIDPLLLREPDHLPALDAVEPPQQRRHARGVDVRVVQAALLRALEAVALEPELKVPRLVQGVLQDGHREGPGDIVARNIEARAPRQVADLPHRPVIPVLAEDEHPGDLRGEGPRQLVVRDVKLEQDVSRDEVYVRRQRPAEPVPR